MPLRNTRLKIDRPEIDDQVSDIEALGLLGTLSRSLSGPYESIWQNCAWAKALCHGGAGGTSSRFLSCVLDSGASLNTVKQCTHGPVFVGNSAFL